MSTLIQKTVYYSGTVQGVGFRATTAALARNFDVAGTVENLPDGRVKVVVEGEVKQVRAFLDELLRELGRFIRVVDAQDDTTEGPFGDPRALDAFKIKY